jgi:hypothetical protein
MLVVILPFSLLVALVQWQRQIQIGACLLVIGFGIFRFVNRRHPRVLARIRPTQLGLWSFAVAIAHGAGLMLVPIYLGLCRAADIDRGHEAAGSLIKSQFRYGRSGLHRPLVDDDRSWRLLGVAGLSLPGSHVRVAKLVQFGCNLGLQPHIGGRSLAYAQPREPELSRVAVPSARPLIFIRSSADPPARS